VHPTVQSNAARFIASPLKHRIDGWSLIPH